MFAKLCWCGAPIVHYYRGYQHEYWDPRSNKPTNTIMGLETCVCSDGHSLDPKSLENEALMIDQRKRAKKMAL